VPSNGTVVKIFTHPENDLDGEFYAHAIQSLKLVSYITVERKILQMDEGDASKLKSGKLRNIMIVCPCYTYMIIDI
jgi:hypothetical protein